MRITRHTYLADAVVLSGRPAEVTLVRDVDDRCIGCRGCSLIQCQSADTDPDDWQTSK